MKTIVLDSYALIAYFEKEDGWETVSNILQDGERGKYNLLLSSVNYGEVYYITCRAYDRTLADEVISIISNLPIEVIDVTKDLALSAASFKVKGGISYADCFAAALTKSTGGELLTGDDEFKVVGEIIKIRWLP